MDGESEHLRIWRFDQCVFNESTLQLTIAGVRIEVERTPLEVLRYLLRHAGEVVVKEEIYQAVWPGKVLSDSVLTKAISRLREALGDKDQNLIKTVHGYGYSIHTRVTSSSVAVRQHDAEQRLSVGVSPQLRPDWRLDKKLSGRNFQERWQASHRSNGEQRVFKFATDSTSASVLKREIEVHRILANRLSNPLCIAPVLDYNWSAPPFFLEIPYYPLGSLKDWAATHGGLENIPLVDRLAMVAAVAQSLAQVHSLGALHTALKPSNLMLLSAEPQWQLVLSDFSSASFFANSEARESILVAPAPLTRSDWAGDGTDLQYLAPELLAGKPFSVQADIYALGVFLYQMVVGDFRKGISAGWEQEVEDELLRADIALCAHGNPARRLASADDLFQRLRSLSSRRQELERARQATLERQKLQDRVRQYQSSNRWRVAAMVILLIGVVSSSLFWWQAYRTKRAVEREALAAQAVSHFLSADVLGAFTASKLNLRQPDIPGFLIRAASQVDVRLADLPEAAASAYAGLALAFADMGMLKHYHVSFEKSQKLLASLNLEDPDAAFRVARILIRSRDTLSTLLEADDLPLWQSILDYARQSPRATAEEILALERYIAVLWFDDDVSQGVKLADTLLAKARMQLPANHPLKADVEASWALMLTWAVDGRWAEAETVMRQSLADLALYSERDELREAVAHTRLGDLLGKQKRYDEAAVELQTAIDLISTRVIQGSRDLWEARESLGLLRIEQLRPTEAVALLEANEAMIDEIVFSQPADLLLSRSFLAEAYTANGQVEKALTLMQELVRLGNASYPGLDRRILLLRYKTIEPMILLGQLKEARQAADVLIKDVARLPKQRHIKMPVRAQLARFDVAVAEGHREIAQQALQSAQQYCTPESNLLVWCEENLGSRRQRLAAMPERGSANPLNTGG